MQQYQGKVVRVYWDHGRITRRQVKIEFSDLPNEIYRDLIIDSDTLQEGDTVIAEIRVTGKRAAQSVA